MYTHNSATATLQLYLQAIASNLLAVYRNKSVLSRPSLVSV